MKTRIAIWITLICANTATAQIKGVVRDSITQSPIGYVSIWVEDENIGTTAEANGSFSIATTAKSKNLIFSSLGYDKKKVPVANAATVLLSPRAFALDEVVLDSRKEKRTVEIGKTGNAIMEAFDSGPKIDVKYFAYSPQYKKTRYLKQVSIVTDSRIEQATFKIHFYRVGTDGFPAAELLTKDFIVTVGKGNKTTYFNLGKFALTMPKSGLFVGFEKMMIQSNKDPARNVYYPLVLYNYVERDAWFSFSGGKWQKQTAFENGQKKRYEPAINLVLTN